jgi:hypothetical protein
MASGAVSSKHQLLFKSLLRNLGLPETTKTESPHSVLILHQGGRGASYLGEEYPSGNQSAIFLNYEVAALNSAFRLGEECSLRSLIRLLGCYIYVGIIITATLGFSSV